MEYINATEKEVVSRRLKGIPAIEITSYEELSKLPIGTNVAIMNGCEMVIGRIDSKEDFIFIFDNVNIITVRENSFKYGNFLYQLK